MAMVNPYTRNELVKKPAAHSEPIDNVSIKIIPKERKNKETASCFDTTGLQTKVFAIYILYQYIETSRRFN